MKTLITTLALAGSLVLGGCGNKKIEHVYTQKDNYEYELTDTIKHSILENNDVTVLKYRVMRKEGESYILTVTGNIDNEYNKIHFVDMNDNNSLLDDGSVMFYKNGHDKRGTTINGSNGAVGVGIWEDDASSKFECYNVTDNSLLSQEVIKEAKKQMENYFEPLYKKLRARAERKFVKETGHPKIKELF